MEKFNIYYGYNKVNQKPLNKEDIDLIKNQKFIYKNINSRNVKINTNELKYIKCIVL